MSQVYPRINGWVGYGDGAEILLRDNVPLDSGHPLVKERPELFQATEPTEPATPPEQTPSRRGRPAAPRSSR
jgi:hypothetical protein